MRPAVPSQHASTLPLPDADAQAQSDACAAMLRDAIDAAGGWISFARFMELALYAPGLGYYAAGARKFGADGDFVTAPEISALFGECLAVTAADVLRQTGGDILELGPGSGKLAHDILVTLDEMNSLPAHYLLLEVSADLRQRQQQRLATLPPALAERASWLDELPREFVGIIIANEVLDVVPVHLLVWRSDRCLERGVALEGGQFAWRDVPLVSSELVAAAAEIRRNYLGDAPPDGYLSEFSPAAAGLVSSLGQSLKRGAMLMIDYGFRGAEFYHRDRSTGTLMCHYRHYAHPDPLRFPGLQDITAHVDFTQVADAGMAAGLTLAGYTTQAQFLLASGLTERLSRVDSSNTIQYLPLTNQVQRLVSPAEMGEFFKVIGFERGGIDLPAFNRARPLPL